MRDIRGNVDLLCFGEAFLQGFNCLSRDYEPVSHGGSFHFRNGSVADRIALDEEDILVVDIP